MIDKTKPTEMIVFGKTECKFCRLVTEILDSFCVNYEYLDVDEEINMKKLKSLLPDVKTVPQCFTTFNGEPAHHVGGYEELRQLRDIQLDY